ncbi:uncharacterized protein J3R85_017134 [Psidium guajava]|nr:uncharacterized protein J3R85_017134 [Psidium guajava]
MSCGSEQGFTSSIGNFEDVQNQSVSELTASLQSAFKYVSFEEVQKVVVPMQRRLNHEVKELSSWNESFKNEFKFLFEENTPREQPMEM